MLSLDRRRARLAALAVATAAGLAGALGALADLAWWLELFAHFRPQYALLLATSGLALLALGPRSLGLAALLLAALNGAPLLHYQLPRPAPAPAGTDLRLVLANLHFGNRQHERVIGYLRRSAPDVAVLLEVTPAWRQALAGLADVLPHQAHSGDVLVASREPLEALRPLPFGEGYAGALVFATGTAGRRVTVIGAHANWPLGPATSRRRNAQLDLLAEAAATAAGPVVLLADLNLTAFAPRFARLLAAAGLADCAAGRGFSPSWPARFPPPGVRIDHCLHGPGVVPLAVANGPWIGSDHYPLEVTLRLMDADARPDDLRSATAPRTSPR